MVARMQVGRLDVTVVVPQLLLQGRYGKVHVGAACPPDRLASLVSLLGPKVTAGPTDRQSASQVPHHHWQGAAQQSCPDLPSHVLLLF
jgi:hypothetical protein